MQMLVQQLWAGMLELPRPGQPSQTLQGVLSAQPWAQMQGPGQPWAGMLRLQGKPWAEMVRGLQTCLLPCWGGGATAGLHLVGGGVSAAGVSAGRFCWDCCTRARAFSKMPLTASMFGFGKAGVAFLGRAMVLGGAIV